ncbi:MAG: glycosyltransferase [Candidatus Sulfotelmatobacter sp.]
MFIERTYYTLKPFLPWSVRILLRRLRARHKRSTHMDVWPIDERAATVPPNWPGWPNGKKFAFVLSHDVEGKKGVQRVERLANLERKHGFRSCFNFVPEGEYRLSDALRGTLDQAGFEVGVHGLNHNGKLYQSKASFAAKAARIRQYLERWHAVGFRSPLMQHELEWMHLLGVEYDSSTFDTDPFEPEPDGARTIFPFWVSAPNGSGFVELPYTLVQDFSLFVVLREPNIDIWKRKLDWVAAHGGMALLNTHPDYLCFDGKPAPDEAPVALYEEFLQYAREKYEGSYWAARPVDVVRYYRDRVPLELRNTRKKICMVAYTSYESDNRVRRYAETLAKRGDQVDVVALSSAQFRAPVEELNGVTVHRVQHRDYNERSKLSYATRLLRFLWSSQRAVTRLHKENRFDLVHVHNMPDFLAFAAWYPKMCGKKLILDIHDLVPELFASKFDVKKTGGSVELLKTIERMSANFVDHVIVSNHLWLETFASRSAARDKCSVFVNHVDPEIFYRHARTREDDKFIVLFPGSMQWHQGLDIAIEAFAEVKKKVPRAEFHLYCGGGGDKAAELKQLTERLGLNESVQFRDSVPLDRIADLMANADLGVVPKRANSFGNEAYSTKIMEFMSQGVPVIASRTKIDAYYFDEKDVYFFSSGDVPALAKAMLEVIDNKALRAQLVARGLEYAQRNSWEHKKHEYLKLVDSLTMERFEGIEAPQGYSQQPTPAETTVLRQEVGRLENQREKQAAASSNSQ